MFCTACSKENPDDAVSCRHCGTDLTLSPSKRGVIPTTIEAPPDTNTGKAPTRSVNRVADRFELLSVIGRGGMGVVYRARDLVLQEEVAIKLLPPLDSADPKETERVMREIRTARKITHPHVIRIHEFGSTSSEMYIAMELMTGGSLAARLAKGPLPVEAAIRIGLGVAEGLAAVHDQGIVHRDVKSLNVLFDSRGVPKLSDFGLSRFASTPSSITGFSGTPHYMSPESAQGKEQDARSDVYALGVTLYESFARRRPFEAESLMRLVVLHAQEAPPPLRGVRPEVPVEVEQVVHRCLEKDPDKRYQNASEVADALSIAGDLERRPSRAHRAAVGIPASRSRLGWVYALGGIGAIAGMIGVMAWQASRSGEPTPTPVAAVSLPATQLHTATETATPRAPAASPSPKATHHVVAAAPSPTPSPVEMGIVDVEPSAYVEVFIDGAGTPAKKINRSGLGEGNLLSLTAGKHTLTLRFSSSELPSMDFPVLVAPGSTITLDVNPERSQPVIERTRR